MRSGSTAQFRRECVFGAAGWAGRFVHRYALPWSDPRRDYEAAIAAKIVGVPSSAQQRSGRLRRLLHTGPRERAQASRQWLAQRSLPSGELIFLDDALVTVDLTFNAVLERAPCLGERPNDLEEPSFCCGFLIPIRRKPYCLPNRKFMGGHRMSQENVRRRPDKGAASLCVPPYCARSATADVLPRWPRSTS